ncbi:GNAT family N-acetyltransferase [Galbibacter sp. EGI 63066]|uniref:GNAT family N-acetyltransferase n=1 Tax=Galbibacter sp. EGI 63066 TaxID=2993559 RepID=UPI0022497795|nr:GNAT family N-acetyltransferase [Galbibacter sp. EGI 63066]MCX2678434.1 GNAT family N-acetyltransferase [Galbibacter sp. EGI 63066]
MEANIHFTFLSEDNIEEIIPLAAQLNPNKTEAELRQLLREMFKLENYRCFGFVIDSKLVGMSSGWISIKLYSGKQLELDNVIIDSSIQSKGLGRQFLSHIEKWAKQNKFKTLELNSYVDNGRSHKFYFNQGFEIIGYHFQKKI